MTELYNRKLRAIIRRHCSISLFQPKSMLISRAKQRIDAYVYPNIHTGSGKPN